eukprot:10833347-Alexandrium_andersonii.AAC.1
MAAEMLDEDEAARAAAGKQTKQVRFRLRCKTTGKAAPYKFNRTKEPCACISNSSPWGRSASSRSTALLSQSFQRWSSKPLVVRPPLKEGTVWRPIDRKEPP